MKVDLSKLEVVDSHSHLFDVSDQQRNLAEVLNFSLEEMPVEQLENTLFYRQMITHLADFLGVESKEEKVLQARKEKMNDAQMYSQYLLDMFKDVNLKTLIVDLGYKPAEVSLDAFEEICPAKATYIYRTETLLDELWEKQTDFTKCEDMYEETLEKAFGELNSVALKSIIGYRTGLEVKDITRNEMLRGGYSEKDFRDYFFLRAVEKAGEKEVPIQVHTSFGESNNVLQRNNPLLLKDILENKRYRNTNIVMVHSGYPYSFEATYMAAMYPNVYLDVSQMVPFVPIGLKRGLRDVMDMCPLNKIMYGSDGLVLPEIFWIGAKRAKIEMELLLNQLIQEKYFDDEYAYTFAEKFFSKTAEDLYKL